MKNKLIMLVALLGLSALNAMQTPMSDIERQEILEQGALAALTSIKKSVKNLEGLVKTHELPRTISDALGDIASKLEQQAVLFKEAVKWNPKTR